MKKSETLKKINVESFNLDHTKVKAPYIRLVSTRQGEKGDYIYKYDIRFCQPQFDRCTRNSQKNVSEKI